MNVFRRQRGFTLVEALAASILLAGAVVVLCAICRSSMERAGASGKYEFAWWYLDQQLTLIDYQGVQNAYQQGDMQGSTEQEGTMFSWQASIEQEEESALYLVTISVTWSEGNQIRKVSTDTLMSRSENLSAGLL